MIDVILCKEHEKESGRFSKDDSHIERGDFFRWGKCNYNKIPFVKRSFYYIKIK
ncbi:hypothetical protein ACQVUL_20605 [Bacillus cytotoxicus]